MNKDRENKIKHLVLSGGGPSGIQTLGALQHLEKKGIWSIEDIETIYATSIGCIISILVALKFDWTTINDYVIKRPWHETTYIEINQVFEMFSKKGLYDISLIHLFFKPFFDSRDISLNITFKDFFQLTNIDLHFFALEINTFTIEDISYETMPDMELLTCAYMSATIPVLFSPVCTGDKCFIDGGLFLNYPASHCIERVGKDNIHEILGVKNSFNKEPISKINEGSTIIEFMMNIITNLIDKNITNNENIPTLTNEVVCCCSPMTLSFLQEALKSQEKREELINKGTKEAENFIEKNL